MVLLTRGEWAVALPICLAAISVIFAYHPNHLQYISGAYYSAEPVAVQAMLNTNMATAFSVLTWLSLDQLWGDKVKTSALCYGVIVGLAAITPAAGGRSGVECGRSGVE